MFARPRLPQILAMQETTSSDVDKLTISIFVIYVSAGEGPLRFEFPVQFAMSSGSGATMSVYSCFPRDHDVHAPDSAKHFLGVRDVRAGARTSAVRRTEGGRDLNAELGSSCMEARRRTEGDLRTAGMATSAILEVSSKRRG